MYRPRLVRKWKKYYNPDVLSPASPKNLEVGRSYRLKQEATLGTTLTSGPLDIRFSTETVLEVIAWNTPQASIKLKIGESTMDIPIAELERFHFQFVEG